jgi:hypothetical protein
MTLKWSQKEFSVGRYCYVVENMETRQYVCYVSTYTHGAKEFVITLCEKPEIWPEVEARLSPGKEVRAEAIRDLLRLVKERKA